MSRPQTGVRLLRLTLVLGGLPPLISGLAAAFAADAYLRTLGSGLPDMFPREAYPFVLFLTNLQGGDAFVAGFSRLVAAFLGTPRLLQLFALAGIAHSGYELWLLPRRLLAWAEQAPPEAVSPVLYTEVWAFLGLHAVLILGFTLGLVQSLRRHRIYGGEGGIDL